MDGRKLRIIQPHLFDLVDLPRTRCHLRHSPTSPLGKWMDETPASLSAFKQQKNKNIPQKATDVFNERIGALSKKQMKDVHVRRSKSAKWRETGFFSTTQLPSSLLDAFSSFQQKKLCHPHPLRMRRIDVYWAAEYALAAKEHHVFIEICVTISAFVSWSKLGWSIGRPSVPAASSMNLKRPKI